jgi:hypothetical protein
MRMALSVDADRHAIKFALGATHTGTRPTKAQIPSFQLDTCDCERLRTSGPVFPSQVLLVHGQKYSNYAYHTMVAVSGRYGSVETTYYAPYIHPGGMSDCRPHKHSRPNIPSLVDWMYNTHRLIHQRQRRSSIPLLLQGVRCRTTSSV